MQTRRQPLWPPSPRLQQQRALKVNAQEMLHWDNDICRYDNFRFSQLWFSRDSKLLLISLSQYCSYNDNHGDYQALDYDEHCRLAYKSMILLIVMWIYMYICMGHFFAFRSCMVQLRPKFSLAPIPRLHATMQQQRQPLWPPSLRLRNPLQVNAYGVLCWFDDTCRHFCSVRVNCTLTPLRWVKIGRTCTLSLPRIVAVCQAWCASNINAWTVKCTLLQTCDGCPECSSECLFRHWMKY